MSEPLDIIMLHGQCTRDKCFEDYGNPDAAPCEFYTDPRVSNPDGPMVFSRSYVVYPTAYNEVPYSDRNNWCLYVTHTGWGWKVSDWESGGRALNKKGKWIQESRGHQQNKSRRYTLEDALERAKATVDSYTVMGQTAAGAVDSLKEGWDVQVCDQTEWGLTPRSTHKLEKVELDKERKLHVMTLDNGEQFLSTGMFHEAGRRFFAKDTGGGHRRVLGTKRAFEVAFPKEKA